MTHIPDPMFRNGLEHYRRPAPASVWERVESGLDRKRRRSIWLKVAAGLVLLMATSTVFWKYGQSRTAETEESVGSQLSAISYQSPVISHQPSAISYQLSGVGSFQSSQLSSIVERSRNNPSDVVHEDLPVVERSRNEPSRSIVRLAGSNPKSTVSSKKFAVGSQQSNSSLEDIPPITLNEPKEIITEPASSNSQEASVTHAATEQYRSSITYTSKEVNEKFLKKEVTAQATPEKKNASGLQKVIDKALDLKNDESVLADLREKKNEWLTINYPSKKRATNK